jgi:broad specificity phosphatase PhoE
LYFEVSGLAELVLVRHAQASFHAEDYDCLSELGHRQARWLGEHFARTGVRFDACCVGTLRRHRQTLDGILEGTDMGTALPTCVLPGLDEYDFRALVGAFEAREPGHPLSDARRRAPGDKAAFYRVLRLALNAWSAGGLGDSGIGSWSGFVEGVESAARELQRLAATHAKLLAVSSGGAMATLLGGRLQLQPHHVFDLNMQLNNTAVCRFFVSPERFLLARWNALPHLEVPGRAEAITYG